MEFRDVVLKRRMVRHFSARPVSAEAVDRILDLSRHAPSAGFTQGQSFVVLTRPDLKTAVGALCGEQGYAASGFHAFISEAPVLLIPCVSEGAYHRRYQEPDKTDKDGREIHWPVPFWYMDIGCSVMIALLAAVDEGLAAAFAGVPDLPALKRLLGIPEEVTPMGVIALGYRLPDTPSPSLKRGRIPDDQYIHREGW
ncbi:MAG: nitroreductase family protein [Bacteroidota bacterium]